MTVKIVDVDDRYKTIQLCVDKFADLEEVHQWCKDVGGFSIYALYIVYETEQDLIAFKLRWL